MNLPLPRAVVARSVARSSKVGSDGEGGVNERRHVNTGKLEWSFCRIVGSHSLQDDQNV